MASLLRVLRAAEHVITAKTTAGENQWAGVTATPNWRDNSVEILGRPGGMVVLCEVGPGGIHKWKPEGLQALGFDHPGPFLASAPAARR